MKRTLAMMVLALQAVLLLPAGAHGDTQELPRDRDTQRAALWSVLEAPHPNVDAAALRRIGGDVQALLIEFATGRKIAAPLQLRALGWLQFYPNAASKAVLQEAIAAPDVHRETLRTALTALANGFGIEALPALQRHLTHKDVYVREAAALALGQLDDRRVRPLLESQLEREPSVAVRDAMMTALKRIAEREKHAGSR